MKSNPCKSEKLLDHINYILTQKTRIRLISRKTGAEVSVQYVTEAFFFLHTINAFEADGHLIVDICCYANAKMLDCMYIEALEVKCIESWIT